ncbi:MAG: pullulanase-type alpha-1,6-glucosidase [Propionicimonas sp.]|nr:pullulanase-type alpha-1,6-glucosidase [Propionicimonas sp.]
MYADVPELEVARGHWLRRDLIAWPVDDLAPGLDPRGLDWVLHWSGAEPIDPREPAPVPWGTAALRFDAGGLPAAVAATVPHLAGHLALRVPPEVPAGEALRGQLAVSVHLPSGRLVRAGSLQVPGVLDDLYAAAADTVLGAEWADGVPTLRLWAPTARRVRLLLWPAEADPHSVGRPVEMAPRPDGAWEVAGEAGWLGSRYRYEVTVYTPHHGRVVTNQVTDPYSVALTVNSTHSVLVDPADPGLAPASWLASPSPPLAHPVDQAIYELHVRDFSVHDPTVPEELRGSFLAFGEDSAGMAHLRGLARAGLTTVQLLPVFDNAAVEEHPGQRTPPDAGELRRLPPDSDQQQRRVGADPDGYNWGYEPWHYLAPEGSYAASLQAAGGAGRIAEFRTLVGGLHRAGLRVVLDMVFNHTASAGQDNKSVLDRIVPGYYHRLTACGRVETSTCCPNVATEHLMAQKLMVDACLWWARQYRVDGYRFDLMGHHSRANLLAVRSALDHLTLERDGVDGPSMTLYGEGWNFGEVAGNARFVQASQGQLGGTSIATFSDRLRDAVRGGGAFEDPRVQGFGTGLADQQPTGGALLAATDLVQLGLAGTLRRFGFRSAATGQQVAGEWLPYNGTGAGYADQPDEVISYVDAHDNETLFDALAIKLPQATPMAERVRLNTLALACATLGQSPVMWHAGTDLLRSKSLDRNSYRSGDWFNYLDFSMTDNGFGAGLPPESDNGPSWPILAPLLADPALKPSPADIALAHAMALDLLRLRASTPLFRLREAAVIADAVDFPVSGTWQQVPGVVVMRIAEPGAEPRWSGLVAVFNATRREVRQPVPFATGGYRLHPVQAAGEDAVVRRCAAGEAEFVVPGHTVAVFVEPA